MKRFLPAVVVMALVWAGCGGKKGSSSSTAVSITISPTTASIAGGATQQFTATVTGSTNTAVTWEVNGATGGDATVGTISTTGLYTAPTKLPSTTTVVVTAQSQADTTKTASASVTLTAPPITMSLNQTTVTLAPGAKQQFVATVTGGSSNAVSWTLNGGSALGIIAPDPSDPNNANKVIYTAPLSPPKEAITLTATSNDNGAFTAKASITVQFGNASLNGHYVFLATQRDNNTGSGFAFRGGTFVADGNGNITAGVTDSNSSAGVNANTSITSGTYSVGTDGRGQATIVASTGSHTFAFALTSNTRGQLIQFDSGGVISGFLRQQDQNATASVSGPFVFSLFGDHGGPYAAVGQMSFTNPNISGTVDIHDLTTLSSPPITGSYSVGTLGRGTIPSVTFGTPGIDPAFSFAFYIIDASTLVFIDLDSNGARTAGTAYAQNIGGFSNSSLGTSVYFTVGNTVSGSKPYGQAGRFATDGAGKFNSGVFDVNSGGSLTSNTSFAGTTYTVSSSGSTMGRGTMSNGTSNFIFWLASSTRGVIMQSDSAIVASGLLFQQQTGFQSVTGGFEFAVSGASADGTTPQAIVGQFSTSGFGVLAGLEDWNIAGTPGPVSPSPTLSGNLSIGITGRGTGAITGTGSNKTVSDTYSFYFISPDQFVMLTSDSSLVLAGTAERQCSDCSF